MGQDIILKVKEEPIIIRMSKQGMTGRSGPAGVKGDDGITWELSLIMEDSPDGRCTMSLYKNGNLCSDEIHYAYVQVLRYGTTRFAVSNYNSNFQGTYTFTYENVRCLFVTVYQDSFMDTILCANSCNYGRSATITVGNVQSGETPKVVNTGDPIDAVFDFTLPKGDQGEVSVHSTETLTAGAPAYVEDLLPNDPNRALLKFGIPNGGGAGARVEDRNLIIDAGTIYTPEVTEDGIIQWTNNFDQETNPTPRRITINPRGDWSSTATYDRLDYVRSGGNGYLAKKSVPAGTAVTNTTYWMRIVDKGDKGDPPNLNIGTVTAKNYGEAPTVSVENNTPSAGTHRLNFGLPMGKTPTIEIGNVEVLQQGARPTVTWTPNQTQTGGVMDWGIPNIAGSGAHVDVIDDVNTLVLDAGAIFTPSVSSAGVISWTNNASQENPSPVNIKGPKGDTGPAGAAGADGQAATIEVTGVNTLAAGTPAYVQEASDSTAQNRKLIFGIPQGPQGVPGQAGTSVPWSGITGSPTDNAALVTKLAEYVLKAGDTMSGVLDSTSYIRLKNSNISIGIAPASDNWGRPYNLTDKDGNPTAQLRVIYRTSGENQTQLNSLNKNGDETVENYLRLVTKNDGTKTVAVSCPDEWRDAIGAAAASHTHDDRYYTESEMDTKLAGKASVSHNHAEYVQKSGDTMTGSLNIASNSPLSLLRDGDKIIGFKSADGTEQGAMWVANSNHAICFRSYDADYSHFERYNLPAPGSLTANANYYILTTKNPVTVAQGGTGGTDSGWKSLTNSSVFTGTIVYRKIGAFCFVTGAVKLVNDLTSDYIDLGTMPTGYRPNTNTIYGFGGGQEYLGVIRITNGGVIRFFKTAQVSTWSNQANIYFQFSYFCE